jgi:hypothetical protein
MATLVGLLALTAGGYAQEATPGPDTAPPDYADIVQTFDAVSKAVDALEQDVNQAQTADDVAQAFTKFGVAMKAFRASIEDLQKKYPDMGAHGSAPPPEVNASLTAMQESLSKLPAILKKAEPFATDPAVQAAIERMKRGM